MIYFKRVGQHSLPTPARQTAGAAGFDLPSAEDLYLLPGCREVICTGFAVQIPDGHAGFIWPRSGLAVAGIDVLAGLIDSDYRGEMKVILINHGISTKHITPGMRIAQLVVSPVHTLGAEEVAELDVADRGAGGFGSTGA